MNNIINWNSFIIILLLLSIVNSKVIKDNNVMDKVDYSNSINDKQYNSETNFSESNDKIKYLKRHSVEKEFNNNNNNNNTKFIKFLVSNRNVNDENKEITNDDKEDTKNDESNNDNKEFIKDDENEDGEIEIIHDEYNILNKAEKTPYEEVINDSEDKKKPMYSSTVNENNDNENKKSIKVVNNDSDNNSQNILDLNEEDKTITDDNRDINENININLNYSTLYSKNKEQKENNINPDQKKIDDSKQKELLDKKYKAIYISGVFIGILLFVLVGNFVIKMKTKYNIESDEIMEKQIKTIYRLDLEKNEINSVLSLETMDQFSNVAYVIDGDFNVKNIAKIYEIKGFKEDSSSTTGLYRSDTVESLFQISNNGTTLQVISAFSKKYNPPHNHNNWKGIACETGYEYQKTNNRYSECIEVSETDDEISDDNDVSTSELPTEISDIPVEPFTFWIIGDSTVSTFLKEENNYYYAKYGYGTQLYNYFDDNVTVNNLALSGTSSKSFTYEPIYQELLENMKPGDYLAFGFGHNDEKREERRYTNPNGDYKTVGSFANSLYENYITIAMEKNVTVILATPVVRRTDKSTWDSAKLHVTKTKDGYEGGDYPQAIRDLGKELDIPVIDMTVKTKELYDSMGYNNTLYLHAWKTSEPSSVDNTHLNLWGGKYLAYIFTRELKNANIDGLSEYILDTEIPTKEENFIKNPDFNATALLNNQ
ncbi:SGNH hydrolase [Anaeromyces robustus]|uniref:SGNH hydrolase n=1 Tax=Anaeromyces robustus TaxID=1754192 RepID=A0A1Y1WVH8_9FUNG|nr:SGNH hydrolase [Anaeromyces robustus]|eukprot:ORX77559.1 SGNH hydrolase [Anaeromyces robustus]